MLYSSTAHHLTRKNFSMEVRKDIHETLPVSFGAFKENWANTCHVAGKDLHPRLQLHRHIPEPESAHQNKLLTSFTSYFLISEDMTHHELNDNHSSRESYLITPSSCWGSPTG